MKLPRTAQKSKTNATVNGSTPLKKCWLSSSTIGYCFWSMSVCFHSQSASNLYIIFAFQYIILFEIIQL